MQRIYSPHRHPSRRRSQQQTLRWRTTNLRRCKKRAQVGIESPLRSMGESGRETSWRGHAVTLRGFQIQQRNRISPTPIGRES